MVVRRGTLQYGVKIFCNRVVCLLFYSRHYLTLKSLNKRCKNPACAARLAMKICTVASNGCGSSGCKCHPFGMHSFEVAPWVLANLRTPGPNRKRAHAIRRGGNKLLLKQYRFYHSMDTSHCYREGLAYPVPERPPCQPGWCFQAGYTGRLHDR